MLLFGTAFIVLTAAVLIYRELAYDPWENISRATLPMWNEWPTGMVFRRRQGFALPEPTEEKPMTLPRDLLPDLEKGDRTDEVISQMHFYDMDTPSGQSMVDLTNQLLRSQMFTVPSPQPQWISPGTTTWTTAGTAVPMSNVTMTTSGLITAR